MSVTRGAGRPQAYRLASGERVPSVTTITGRFKESGGLLFWAWSCGMDGIDYREKKQTAADAGSLAHHMIEGWIHNGPTDDEPVVTDGEMLTAALQAYAAFLDWADQVKLEILETEVPLISERYKFGGTLDANALVAGKPTLLDWKTSNGVWPEMVVQLAAYRELLRERGEDYRAVPKTAQLLRVGKEHADFHLHNYTESVLDMGWRWFLLAREMYEIDKDLKKVCR